VSTFEAFWDQLLQGIGDLAEAMLEDIRSEALADGKAVLEDVREDLERWTRLVEEGRLTRDDLTFLMRGRVSVAEMHALKRAGLALADIDRFRRSLIGLVIDTAFDVFAPL
jgi:hypothetical protein